MSVHVYHRGVEGVLITVIDNATGDMEEHKNAMLGNSDLELLECSC